MLAAYTLIGLIWSASWFILRLLNGGLLPRDFASAKAVGEKTIAYVVLALLWPLHLLFIIRGRFERG